MPDPTAWGAVPLEDGPAVWGAIPSGDTGEPDFSDVAAGHSTAAVPVVPEHKTGIGAGAIRALTGQESLADADRAFKAQTIAQRILSMMPEGPLVGAALHEPGRIAGELAGIPKAKHVDEMAAHAVSALPLVGGPARSAIDTIGRGDVAGGLTEAAILALGSVLGGGKGMEARAEIGAVRAAKAAKGAATLEAGAAKAGVDAPLPGWLKENAEAAVGAMAPGVADQVADLAAQRLTAKQIAERLGITAEQVRAVRLQRGIPSMSITGPMGAGGQPNPDFDAWLKNKNAAAPQPQVAPPPPDPSISATPPAPEAPPVGKPVPVPPVADVDSAMRKLSENIASAKTASAETRQLQSNELAKRFAKAERNLATGGGGEGSLGAAKGALRGELPKAQYEPIAHLFSKEERGLLFSAIEKQPTLTMPEKIRAYDALKKVMDAGSVPQPNEIALLGRALGPDVAEAIAAKTRTFAESKLMKAWNVPRTLLSGPDMSMILRQAKVATSGHPRIAAGAIGKSTRAWVEGLGKNPGKTYEATLAEIRSRPNAQAASPGQPGLYDLSGVDFTFKSGTGELKASEEQFLRNNVVNKIPGFGRLYKASEESALTFLNKMRADVFDSIAKPYLQAGKTFESDPDLFKGIARWTNITTGRGGLGPLERSANTLAAVLFAPRLASANFQLLSPTTYVALYRANPKLFYTAVKDMTAYAASRATIIAGAALAGADVNNDPRSAEFGKIRVGRARLDLWGGEIQPVRLIGQEVTGERTKLSGERVPYDRMEQIGNYLMQRRHPSLKFVMNFIRQKSDMGDTYEFHKELAELLSALPAQDLVALEKEQPNAMWMMIPGVLGAGVNTYDEPAVLSAKDKTDMRAAEAARDTARQLGQEIEARRPKKAEPSPQERRMSADLTVKRRKVELEIWALLDDHHFAKARAVARQANRQYGFEFKVDKMYRAKRLQQPAMADAAP